ncbi:MAG: hypothetical protein ACI9O1_000138 [Candidatus Thalassarchaeaceae archaeon]|jgi:hypothetical protein
MQLLELSYKGIGIMTIAGTCWIFFAHLCKNALYRLHDEGEEQARMSLVIAGPAWVWFVVCCFMELEVTLGKEPMVMTWDDNVPPLIFWGICARVGYLVPGGSNSPLEE